MRKFRADEEAFLTCSANRGCHDRHGLHPQDLNSGKVCLADGMVAICARGPKHREAALNKVLDDRFARVCQIQVIGFCEIDGTFVSASMTGTLE
jgi:hypothetical protein